MVSSYWRAKQRDINWCVERLPRLMAQDDPTKGLRIMTAHTLIREGWDEAKLLRASQRFGGARLGCALFHGRNFGYASYGYTATAYPELNLAPWSELYAHCEGWKWTSGEAHAAEYGIPYNQFKEL